MPYGTKEVIKIILDNVSSMEEITSIGQTGDINFIPKAGECDIDIFVFCEKIPEYNKRKELYDNFLNDGLAEKVSMNVCEGGVWGTGDIFIINGVETMLMYFTEDETLKYLSDVLSGKYLDSVNGFYPVGRCSTIKNINILYDNGGFLSTTQDKLNIYPEALANKLFRHHIKKSIDEEDFGRAVARKDVLFYHQVLENALDHFLQALYAVNKTFFPSRKRTYQYIEKFAVKPGDCYNRLLEVIRLGADPDGIPDSYAAWCELVNEMKL